MFLFDYEELFLHIIKGNDLNSFIENCVELI